MVHSNGRISGHSGTEFKHRKAFAQQKAFYHEKARVANSSSHRVIDQQASQLSNRKFTTSKTDLLIKYLIHLPIILTTVGGLLFMVIQCVSLFNDDSEERLQVQKEQMRLKKAEAYPILVKTGDSYYKQQALDAAQVEYVQALQLDEYGKRARIGLVKVLIKRCQIEGQSCNEINTQLQFIEQMNLLSKQEITALKTEIEPWLTIFQKTTD